MDEFVSKKLLVAKFNELASKYIDGDKRQRGLAYTTAADMIALADAADVQPVNQWISVKDRLPDEDGWYLVYKHNRVRVAEWCKDCWYNESDLPIDDCTITHWQLLPEPPKEGEHND